MPSLPGNLFVFNGTFFVSLLFGLIGTGYFMYGKKQEKYDFLLIGLILGIYPFFVKGALTSFLLGLVLSALPFFL